MLSSGLLHSSWSKICELHESRPNQDSVLEIETYQEAKYTLVVFVAQSICRNSSATASTLLESDIQNPFPFLFSEKFPSFSVHTSAFKLFTSAYESLTALKSEVIKFHSIPFYTNQNLFRIFSFFFFVKTKPAS